MASNSLYPGFIKLFYEVTDLTHTAILPCIPSGSDDDWVVATRGGAAIAWEGAITTYVNTIKALTGAACNFIQAELWTYDTPEGDPTFRDVIVLNIVGTGVANNLKVQETITFRTASGGVMKPTLLEPNAGPDLVLTYPEVIGGPVAPFVDYLLGSTNWLVGRDGAYPIGMIRLTTKINDALRRKRLLIS